MTSTNVNQPTGSGRMWLPSRFGANYARLWTATMVSTLGDGLRLTALPLLASRITQNPMAIAGIWLASGLPWLLFSLLGGAVVDRLDRRRLMVRVQIVRGAVVGAFTIYALASTPPIPFMYALLFILTTCDVVFSSAAPSMLPRLVPGNLLASANSRLFGGQITAKEIAGPPLGSFLLTLAIAAPFAADSVSYLAGAILLSSLSGDFRPDEDARAAGTVWRSAIDGLSWVWHDSFVRTIILGFGVANVMRSMTISIFVLYALRVLHITGIGYGVLLTATAIGALAGSLSVGRLRRLVADPELVVGAMLLLGLVTILLAVTSSAYLAGLANALFGFGSMVWNVVGVSAQQKAIPDAMMGRVMAVDSLVTWGAIPVGSLLGGLLASSFGLRVPILAGGLLTVGTVLAIGRTLRRSMQDLPADPKEQP